MHATVIDNMFLVLRVSAVVVPLKKVVIVVWNAARCVSQKEAAITRLITPATIVGMSSASLSSGSELDVYEKRSCYVNLAIWSTSFN